MEPTSFNVGDDVTSTPSRRAMTRFNGADVFQRRRPHHRRNQTPRVGACFNGADVFQRRRRPRGASKSKQTLASMEPTSFNVGDCLLHLIRLPRSNRFNGADVFQRRRREYSTFLRKSWEGLQWSRRLSTSETSNVETTTARHSSLQWSRRLSTSETIAINAGPIP